MIPKQQEIELPLLKTLDGLGGKAHAQDVYAAVTKLFPQLTEADLSEQLPSGGNKWTNRIQWVRQSLVARGEMTSAGHGVWAVTEKGASRIKAVSLGGSQASSPQTQAKTSDPVSVSASVGMIAATPSTSTNLPSANLEDIADEYLDSFTQKVLNKLQDLSSSQFEEFAGNLLRGYGFQKVVITGKSGDGGIDGNGQLKVGMATVKAAFQCKRWQPGSTVGSKDVQAFRGSIQGQFEQGYFFTTSTFTKAAQQESIKAGAAPVILFEGRQVVEIMIEKGIGVRWRPIEVYEDQLDQLFDK